MKLQLKYPCNPFYVTQVFGENLACAEDNSTLPVGSRKVVTKVNKVCPTGYIELYPLLGMKGHTGLDLIAKHGQEVFYSAPEGIVEEIQAETERGLGLGIVTKNKYEVEGGEYQIKTRYWHLQGFKVKLGDVVRQGDLIGWADNTGISSGDHLHFECKPVALNSEGKYYNIFQSNGYYGAIDPQPFFTGEYAQVEKYIFTRNIYYGQLDRFSGNQDVSQLQKLLAREGFFDHEITGYYGPITCNAVFNWQLKNIQLSLWEQTVLRGSLFGKKSRLFANNK